MDDENHIAYGLVAKLLLTYTCMVAWCLFLFFFYQTCNLGMRNVTSNEDIRHRWNGHHRNKKLSKMFRKEAGFCGRLQYILYGEISRNHGPSKLSLYAELVELYYKIKGMKAKQ
jgi:hypothetical protein